MISLSLTVEMFKVYYIWLIKNLGMSNRGHIKTEKDRRAIKLLFENNEYDYYCPKINNFRIK